MKTEQLLIDFTKPLVHYENNSESQNNFDANIEHFSNHCKILYKALIKGVKMTSFKAMNEYGIGHLPRRIKDLTDIYGVKGIQSEYVGRHKEYYINQNDISNLIN